MGGDVVLEPLILTRRASRKDWSLIWLSLVLLFEVLGVLMHSGNIKWNQWKRLSSVGLILYNAHTSFVKAVPECIVWSKKIWRSQTPWTRIKSRKPKRVQEFLHASTRKRKRKQNEHAFWDRGVRLKSPNFKINNGDKTFQLVMI